MIDRPFRALQLTESVVRLTQPLFLGLDHVHCYLLRASDGGWLLVDAGLGVPQAEARWEPVLAELDGPVERVFVTHFHPDHVGGSADVAELTGSQVFQGRIDFERCDRAWGGGGAEDVVGEHLRRHGIDDAEAAAITAHHADVASVVRYVPDPVQLDHGDHVDGWEVHHLPGHADGHLCLLRDGVLVAGDTLLDRITPNIGLFPGSNPDPLADFLETLRRLISLDPVVAYPGHGEPIRDPARRAQEILDHHAGRLARTSEAVRGEARTAAAVARELFPDAVSPPLRRFAFAESLAHLEHLALAGAIERLEDDERTTYRSG
jgi:glyoxylase-like metal-dependent hydrolase (beta-lactamase superfamily II)